MGNTTRDFDYKLELQNLTTKEKKISHNALEAARIAANRVLEEELEPDNFMLKLVPYPHEVIRKNKRTKRSSGRQIPGGHEICLWNTDFHSCTSRERRPHHVS